MFDISKLDDFMNQTYGGETEKEFIDIVQEQFGTVVVNLLDYVTEFVHEQRIKFEAMSAYNNNTEKQTKKCSNCDQLLSLSAFDKKKTSLFGLNSTCKACVSEDKRKDYLSTVIAKGKIPCKHCGRKFGNKNLLRRHKKLHHPSKEQLVVPNTFDTKSKICFMCPDRKEFKRVEIYHMHLATVHNMKGAYSCQKCNFTTFTEISLKKHINKKHAQKYVMKCPVQGCTFTCKDHAYKGRTSTKLYWHLRNIHGGNIVGASAVRKGTIVKKYNLKRKLTKVKASLGVPLHGMKTRTRVFKRQRF